MSQKEKSSTKHPKDEEEASSQKKEGDTIEHPTSQGASPLRQETSSPTTGTSSIFFASSPVQSPLLPEQGPTHLAPRYFNPPLPV